MGLSPSGLGDLSDLIILSCCNRVVCCQDPDASVGRMELVLIFLVSVMRTWHQNRMVYIKRDLMEATYKRNTTMFKAVMYETVVLSLVSSGIFAFHRFLKERLAMLWREKLTGQLHR